MRWVIEVRLDRRWRATETIGDLSDREALELAVMPRQGDRPATLENPTRSRGRRLDRHNGSRYLAQLAFPPRSARKARTHRLDLLPAPSGSAESPTRCPSDTEGRSASTDASRGECGSSTPTPAIAARWLPSPANSRRIFRQRPARGLAVPRSSASTDQLDTGDDVDSTPVVGALESGEWQVPDHRRPKTSAVDAVLPSRVVGDAVVLQCRHR